jgi:hypothetical protein
MACAESYCRKIFSGKTPYSSTIAKWLARQRVFVWMLRHKERPLEDPRNLYRKCKVLDKAKSFPIRVKQPSEYTINQVEAQILAIDEQIQALGRWPQSYALNTSAKRRRPHLIKARYTKQRKFRKLFDEKTLQVGSATSN